MNGRVAHRTVSGSIDSLAYLGRCVPLLSCLVLSCLVLVLPLHSVAASLASRVTTTARSDHWHYMEDTIVNNNGGGGGGVGWGCFERNSLLN